MKAANRGKMYCSWRRQLLTDSFNGEAFVPSNCFRVLQSPRDLLLLLLRALPTLSKGLPSRLPFCRAVAETGSTSTSNFPFELREARP